MKNITFCVLHVVLANALMSSLMFLRTSALRGPGFGSKPVPGFYIIPRAGLGRAGPGRAGPGRAWAYILRARAGPGLKTI